ncbi:preprotein translocase subunit SecG [Thermodesulfovibrionales bacterium]|nr:preprotein translocase subunit SecG [Thermodesulfovibrionales bacterium]MCL0061817.1 preprotein translocase subunit SecG [Thermodesulfovibrionales bacterium]MCL0068493.1 preprotein translocase subunit SecG [Thermodesulfovibrionales bacterium]MCL0072127.1 preprotein translocase subunit SecG [Thermodesulfovibrionales bacterium]
MLETILTIVHVLVCLLMILIVLLQSGSKGAQMGAAFGSSSQTMFGGRGAATFLQKLTVVGAIILMLTSLTLSILITEPATIIE